jgi:hypothetical protein
MALDPERLRTDGFSISEKRVPTATVLLENGTEETKASAGGAPSGDVTMSMH